jgi:hypothetical protein
MKIGLQAFVTDSTANPANIARKAEAVGFDLHDGSSCSGEAYPRLTHNA